MLTGVLTENWWEPISVGQLWAQRLFTESVGCLPKKDNLAMVVKMQSLDAVSSEILAAVAAADSLDALEAVRINALGKRAYFIDDA